MNRIIYSLFISLLACPAVQAIDLVTDASCKKLATVIKDAQSVNTCKTVLQKITQNPKISAADQQEILDQSLQLARTQKAALEQELTILGNKTKNVSNIKWGVGQLTFGSYLLLGTALALHIIKNKNAHNVTDYWSGKYLLPDKYLIERDTENIFLILFTAARILLINPVLGTYFLYKGYKNLKIGLNYKQHLLDKIAHLEAIITYLQSLQTNN